jgi:PAS domain S-box-containing protein
MNKGPTRSGGLLRRFVWGTVAGLVLSSVVFLFLYIGMYRSELAQERAGVTENVSRLLLASLENAMLKADVEGLRGIITHLGQQPGIVAVRVTNPAGEIRFASRDDWVGQRLSEPFHLPSAPTTEVMHSPEGVAVLRSTIPVLNRPECRQCHGPVELRPVNGLLLVDYEAEPLHRKVRNTTLLLMSAGALIVLLNLAGGWWFMRRFVLRPVAKLAAFSERLRGGDLGARVALRCADEFDDLAQTVNGMAAELERRMEQLTEQRRFLQSILDAIPDGLRVIDSEYRQVLVNQAYLEHIGATAEETIGRSCFESSHARGEACPPTLNLCPLAELAGKSAPIKTLQTHLYRDGTPREAEVYAAPLDVDLNGVRKRFIVESIRDLQSQMRYSHEQRLAELGKLAAGVAHEVYNPLSSVRMMIYSLRGAVSRGQVGPDEIRKLDLVEHEIETCVRVTQNLLKLSHLPEDRPEPVDICTAIGETLSLLRLEAEQSGVRIIADLPPQPLWVMASDSALRMIALNLAQNAIHAMGATGGELRVRVAPANGRVEASFEDNGPGIHPEFIEHLFDPFFSRRADGKKGTGLGLSICRSLAEKYGGDIRVQTELGSGTRFTVSFADPSAAVVSEVGM